MKSMTGYAKRQCTAADRKYTVEIKTLNSKTLDIIAKLPASLRSRELDIRTLLNPLERGKIDMVITSSTPSCAYPTYGRPPRTPTSPTTNGRPLPAPLPTPWPTSTASANKKATY